MGPLLKTTAIMLIVTVSAAAHDTWVQSNVAVVRTGNHAQVDLMLGNHGNQHRDFKLAGKPDIAASTLVAITPDGRTLNLKPLVIDQGYGEKDGYYTAQLDTAQNGLYLVTHTMDKVVSYAPKRSIKSAKTFILANDSLDKLPLTASGYDRVLRHPLELVPQVNPVTPMGPGIPIRVRLLLHGKPLAQTRVSFIPRGVTLAEGFDERYERMTDDEGIASFEPTSGNMYLIVAHYEDLSASGEGHTSTKYSATLTIRVPQRCVCCD